MPRTPMATALHEFLEAGERLADLWNEDEVHQYPRYLPNFVELLAELREMLEPRPRAERLRAPHTPMSLQALLSQATRRPWHRYEREDGHDSLETLSGRLIAFVFAQGEMQPGEDGNLRLDPEGRANAELARRAVQDIEGLCRSLLAIAGTTLLGLSHEERLRQVRQTANDALDIVGWDREERPRAAVGPAGVGA